jgi:aminomethyltransferase
MLNDALLKKTPLYEKHEEHKALLQPFGGWMMPIQYTGILAEYEQTRQRVSIFDISHMGEFIVEGDLRKTGLDRIVTSALASVPVRASKYGAMLNPQGGVIDDLIVFRMDEDQWLLVVNAATTEKDKAHLEAHLTDKAVFKDITMDTGKVDIQGPEARQQLLKLVKDIDKLDYYSFDFFDLLGENVLISRTGYTGELGYEIYYPWDKTVLLWDALLDLPGVEPAGLGARDMLRLEKGYSLYGHELKENVTALTSGLGRFVDFDKEFIGKEALSQQKKSGLTQKIMGIESQNRRSPRQGYSIFTADGKPIGTVTSGGFSPALEKGIGLAFIDVAHAQKGEVIQFGDDRRKFPGTITSRVFYKQGSLKD